LPAVRRTALVLCALLFVVSGCGGGGDEPKGPPPPSKAVADKFVNALLEGRPDAAAELLSTQNSGFEFNLPAISIDLQARHYQVVRSKQRNQKTFVYEFRGRRNGKPDRAVWAVVFIRDLDAWRIETFDEVKTF